MRKQAAKPMPERHNAYSGYFPSKHNMLGSRRIMFIRSAALQRTRCSNPLPDYLAPHGLSWSDINQAKVDMKSESVEGIAFVVAILLLVFVWIVLPELLFA